MGALMTIACRLLFALAALVAITMSPAAAQADPLPPALEATVAQSHEALRLILNGDPSGYAALFADRDDITLGNPFGPFGKGRAAVLAALNNAAKKYTDGTVRRVERIAFYGGGDRYVLVEIEHDRAKLGASADVADFAARVTSVYEKIGAQWKLVHRHADPITSARPAESMRPGHVPPKPVLSAANGEANKALVRTFLKALEAGDIAAMVAIRGGGGPTHGPNGESRVSAAGSSLAERCPMCAALPDRKISIEAMVAEGDLVTVRSNWTGTYSGGYRGMEITTPKSVTVRYTNIYRIADGRIVENWASYDRLALAEQLGLALTPNLRQTQPAVAPDGIVGTWRLVAFEDTEDGKTVYRFGERPNGLFVYTADGHVIIHIAHPANPNCLAPAKKYGPDKIDDTPVPACTSAQMQTAMEGTVAYMGTYSVAMDSGDPSIGVVTHRVTADLSNGYIGTNQPRPFRIAGDRIEIGDGKTWRRVLERVVR